MSAKKFIAQLGGAFIYSENPAELGAWYRQHLGLEGFSSPDGSFHYLTLPYISAEDGKTYNIVWSIMKGKPGEAKPKEEKRFMINYRVYNMNEIVDFLRSQGIEVKGIEDHPEGRFAWCADPDGNQIELWEDTSATEDAI